MNKISIFTDGSSRGNPGPGGFGAIVVNGKDVYELGGREEKTTNNKMELTATIEALSSLYDGASSKIEVYSDSKYVIKGITEWVFGWQKNNWQTSQKKPVENRDLWERLFSLTEDKKIDWHYVEGHSGHPGNERCDVIATSFADGEPTNLFQGSLDDYDVDLSKEHIVSKKINLYLSFVDEILMEHETWTDCEKRVKGIKGAKFKKVSSEAQKNKIIEEWMTDLEQA